MSREDKSAAMFVDFFCGDSAVFFEEYVLSEIKLSICVSPLLKVEDRKEVKRLAGGC